MNLLAEISPFDLDQPQAYAQWRAAKLATQPTCVEDLIVEVDDPARPTPAPGSTPAPEAGPPTPPAVGRTTGATGASDRWPETRITRPTRIFSRCICWPCSSCNKIQRFITIIMLIMKLRELNSQLRIGK